MKRFTVLIAALVLVLVMVGASWAESPSTRKRNNWNALQRFPQGIEVGLPDAAAPVSKVDQHGHSLYKPHVVVDMAGLATYTIDMTNGSNFWIDDHESMDGTRGSGSGVSILFKKITPEMNNYVARIYKAPDPFSGTTDICVSTVPWVSGTTDIIWNVTSGATCESSAHVMPEVDEMDAPGDWLEFTAVYGASGSTWYQTGRYIQ